MGGESFRGVGVEGDRVCKWRGRWNAMGGEGGGEDVGGGWGRSTQWGWAIGEGGVGK